MTKNSSYLGESALSCHLLLIVLLLLFFVVAVAVVVDHDDDTYNSTIRVVYAAASRG